MADRCDNCRRRRVDGKGEKWEYIYLTPRSVVPQLRCPNCIPRQPQAANTTPEDGVSEQ